MSVSPSAARQPNRAVKHLAAAVAAFLCLGFANPTHAALMFDFSWSSTGAAPTPAGAVGSASGTITIDKMAGESFGVADVTAIAISVMSTNTAPVSYISPTDVAFLVGNIDGAGATASFTDFFIGNVTTGFGCTSAFCAGAGRVAVGSGGVDDFFDFGNGLLAQQSFVLTASAPTGGGGSTGIPGPAGVSLLGLGLAGLALIGRRRPIPV